MKYAKLIVDRRINGEHPDGHPCHKALPVGIDEDGISVEIIQCSMLGPNAGCSLIRLKDEGGRHADAFKEPYYSIYGESSFIKIGTDQYLATVMNNACALSHIVSESGIFLTSAKPIDDNIIEWTVLASNSTYIRNFIKRARDAGYNITRRYLADPESELKLTTKQEAILRYALENGFYDIPKKITTDDLCRKFDCSKATLNVILRSAERKIIELYMEPGRPPMDL